MYESKAMTTNIRATSKVTVKIKDNFFSVEYTEERSIPDSPEVDLEQERKILFDDVNNTVDTQVEDIVKSYKR